MGTYTGTLIKRAEARTLLIGKDGRAVPVLCLDVQLENDVQTHLHVEQPFHTANYNQAQAAARRLKKGMRVTVQAPLADLHLVAKNAIHIHTHRD